MRKVNLYLSQSDPKWIAVESMDESVVYLESYGRLFLPTHTNTDREDLQFTRKRPDA